MSVSRRHFLRSGSMAFVASAVPFTVASSRARLTARQLRSLSPWSDYVPQRADPALLPLLTRAIEAARAAGATYADARYLTRATESWPWSIRGPFCAPDLSLRCGIGVRALYDGYWGYAAHTGHIVSADRAAALGRDAAAQARTGAKGPRRTVELAPIPVVQNGTWTTPIEIDPFTVAWEEKYDVLFGIGRYYSEQPFEAGSSSALELLRDEQTFVSTDGASYQQTLYRTDMGNASVQVAPHWRTLRGGLRMADGSVSAAAAGWEYALAAATRMELDAPAFIAQALDARRAVAIDVGRYEVVFDGAALGKLADMHLGAVTELDRAMGFLANSLGTSYLNKPLEMLGTHKVGAASLNVSANRSMPAGLATVQWDAEGVVPDEAVLVKDGTLTDFQTTRESASWLAPYYQRMGKPVRSHGGLHSDAVERMPEQGVPNLVVAPARDAVSFSALCSGVKKGLAVLSGWGRTDQQALNGEFYGDVVYEITNGKLGRALDGGVVLSRAPELWKNIVGLGGPSTVAAVGTTSGPRRWWDAPHTVSAPAALIKDVVISVNPVQAV